MTNPKGWKEWTGKKTPEPAKEWVSPGFKKLGLHKEKPKTMARTLKGDEIPDEGLSLLEKMFPEKNYRRFVLGDEISKFSPYGGRNLFLDYIYPYTPKDIVRTWKEDYGSQVVIIVRTSPAKEELLERRQQQEQDRMRYGASQNAAIPIGQNAVCNDYSAVAIGYNSTVTSKKKEGV